MGYINEKFRHLKQHPIWKLPFLTIVLQVHFQDKHWNSGIPLQTNKILINRKPNQTKTQEILEKHTIMILILGCLPTSALFKVVKLDFPQYPLIFKCVSWVNHSFRNPLSGQIRLQYLTVRLEWDTIFPFYFRCSIRKCANHFKWSEPSRLKLSREQFKRWIKQ